MKGQKIVAYKIGADLELVNENIAEENAEGWYVASMEPDTETLIVLYEKNPPLPVINYFYSYNPNPFWQTQ